MAGAARRSAQALERAALVKAPLVWEARMCRARMLWAVPSRARLQLELSDLVSVAWAGAEPKGQAEPVAAVAAVVMVRRELSLGWEKAHRAQ